MTTIRCAYCRGEHPSMKEFEECAAKVIAWEANEWRRDHEDMKWIEAELARQAEETLDCADGV